MNHNSEEESSRKEVKKLVEKTLVSFQNGEKCRFCSFLLGLHSRLTDSPVQQKRISMGMSAIMFSEDCPY